MKKQKTKQNNKSKQNKTLNILCFAKPRAADDDDRKNRKKERSQKHYNHIFFYL